MPQGSARPDQPASATTREPRPTSLASLLTEIDAISPAPVLLTSKRLEESNDLDLICRAADRRAIGSFLADSGFRSRPAKLGGRAFTEQWVRFCEGTTVVDLNPAERWGLSERERNALFEQATPLDGFRQIAAPSPHHTILLASRRLVRGQRLSDKRKAHLAERLQEDKDAWEKAAQHAPAWCCTRALALLRRLWEHGVAPSRRELLIARLELTRSLRADGTRRAASLTRARIAQLRPPTIVALSGLDGSGKSTQVQQLDAALRALGIESRIVWKPMGHSPTMRFVRRSAKRLLGAKPAAAPTTIEAAPARRWDPNPKTKALRERSSVATQLWAAFVGLSAAGYYRREQLRHRGEVLVFDRHLLDTRGQLRFFYGARSRLRLALGLVELVCPRADRAYLLDVPAEVAHERKPLQYDIAELSRQAELYRQEAARLGAFCLDATLPSDVLAETIIADLWTRLG